MSSPNPPARKPPPRNQFEEQIAASLKEHLAEATPPPRVWQNIRTELDTAQRPRPHFFSGWLGRASLVVQAMMVLMILVSSGAATQMTAPDSASAEGLAYMPWSSAVVWDDSEAVSLGAVDAPALDTAEQNLLEAQQRLRVQTNTAPPAKSSLLPLATSTGVRPSNAQPYTLLINPPAQLPSESPLSFTPLNLEARHSGLYFWW